VNQRKKNGLNFLYLHRVTCLHSGNNPDNGLVTEILQYFTIFCFLAMWQIRAIQLIINRLRYHFAVLFLLAFAEITHVARHTFATTICLTQGVPIETLSQMMGHLSIKTTQIYAEITRTKINEDMTNLEKRIEGRYRLVKNEVLH
jgi:integrase